ncbi:hypothetical protein F4779DRAFT_630679 [Xylariaceae sp. FL0662B]|nr:hypothetical protein F4779DRAFT_630679 [Xylariaceae sp. FL0662B]
MWNQLNTSVSGRLVHGNPLGHVCHVSGYDPIACDDQNNSYSPFTSRNNACALGNPPVYAINITNAEDVKKGINFAKDNNVRLVIKNTSHDYIGSAAYDGPAVKIGAAASHGFRVVGSYCPTVGAAAGFPTGGGHGTLGASYGLGADNTLEFENPDVYWALSGGGSSIYAVIISTTVKAHADSIVAGARFSFNNTNDTAYYSAIEAWNTQLLRFDKMPGLSTFWSFTKEAFSLGFATWPGVNPSAMEDALKPFLLKLQSLNLEVLNYETTNRQRFWDHYQYFTGSLPYGPYAINTVLGGRIIPRSTVQKNITSFIVILEKMSKTPGFLDVTSVGLANNFTHARVGNTAELNSVPVWRDSLYFCHIDFPISITDFTILLIK